MGTKRARNSTQVVADARPSWRRLWVWGRRLPFDPWKAGLAFLLAGAVVVVLGWVVLGSRLLVVREFDVAGELHVVADRQVVEAADVGVGTPLARLDADAVERRVQGIRQVEAARVKRVWPSTVRIHVTERTPVAASRTDSGYHLLDRFGVRVTTVSRAPGDVPLVEFDGTGGPASADSAARAALAVADALPRALTDKVAKVVAADAHDVALRLENGGTVEWGDPRRSAEKARTLEALLQRDAEVYDVSAPGVATTRDESRHAPRG